MQHHWLPFFGALRVSELMASLKKDTSDRALKLQDVEMGPPGAQIHVRYSKIDQHQKGALAVLGPCSDPELYLLRALSAFLKFRSRSPGLLFRHNDGTPLTRY